MFRLIEAIRAEAKRHASLVKMHQQITFLRQFIAHRRLIRSYMSQHGQIDDQIIDTASIIGYVNTTIGLGESARGMATALEAVGTPFSIYPYNGYTGHRPNEAIWARLYDVENVHATNIFCMATDQTKSARRIIGKRYTENSYNILNTFWELPSAPEAWRPDLEFFDELWAPNYFVADALRPIFSNNVYIIPPCINVNGKIASARAQFGLDTTKFYFLFSFDINSYPERKNPLAVASAFEIAFGDGRDNVGLIFKIAGTRNHFPTMMSQLEAAARRDRRITILHGDWKRADFLALMASIDCYVSLHRSEGFGQGMAEAMALGKPVIGTAYSGNTDFLTEGTGYPVPYKLRLVAPGEYPNHTGNSWADPDIRVAAEIMNSVANRTDDVRHKALQGQAYVRQHYSPKTVGSLMAARLREITVGSPRE